MTIVRAWLEEPVRKKLFLDKASAKQLAAPSIAIDTNKNSKWAANNISGA